MILGPYEPIRHSGFLSLSLQTKLNKYTGFTAIGTRFNPDIIKRLNDDVSFEQLKACEKKLILLFDKMKTKSSLMYSKSSGKLVGFTEVGHINGKPNQFERTVSGEMVPKILATHVLCIMARGLVKYISYPIGYFSSCRLDSYQLYQVLWQRIVVLEMVGFKVNALVSDGASPNRRFYIIHKLADGSNLSEAGVVY